MSIWMNWDHIWMRDLENIKICLVNNDLKKKKKDCYDLYQQGQIIETSKLSMFCLEQYWWWN